MADWQVNLKKNFHCNAPIFIEGLPGIGNVGKIAVDYLIDKLEAEKVGSFFSTSLPNSVFVNEKNLVQLPSIELYYAKIGKQDFLFLSGDTQPSDEEASYAFTHTILAVLFEYKVKEIITTGGIGLEEMPEKPEVYTTGNKRSFVNTFAKSGANKNIYGVVGPIVGVSGLLLGLAKKVPAASLLVETYAHPMYIGLKEARQIILLLKKHYKLKVSLDELDEEIAIVHDEENTKKTKYAKPATYGKDVNYIG
jgi:proteasome assembly chaperone (PAC2) family protein